MNRNSHFPIILVLLFNFTIIFAQQNFNPQNNDFDNSTTQNLTNQITAIKNQKWETTLVSTGSYSNPYKDVILSVHYSNSDNSITFDAHGFWDGGSTFRIRSSFPEVGEWTWETTCSNVSDLGLHNKTGSITVSDYIGTNKLFNLGGIKVSSNNKYLTYGDDTPFFWMGGTAWALPMAATYQEWKTYIDDRQSKKFSVVQVAPAKSHGYNDFTSYPLNQNDDVCFFSDDKWNPQYWQEFDKFVEYANSKEIVVVVVGLAEPVYDMLSDEDAKLFTRNFGARMEGFHVVLSPAFDTYQPDWNSDYDSIGEELANSRHLISQHTGHTYGGGGVNEYALYFRDKSYLDFSMNQTGHNGGDTTVAYRKAREWNIGLLNESPMKPVINTEALYSAGRYAVQITDEYRERKGTDENARAIGWLTLLSGSLGYTYGAQGIWNYGEETDPSIPLTIRLDSAIAFVSSTQMKYLVDFFSSIEWWKLEPNHSAIISNITDETKKMAFAISDNGKFGAAFLPDNNSIKIDMIVFENSINATWFNPITAVYTNGEQNVLNSGNHTFTPPSSGEWALLLDHSTALSLRIFLDGAYSTDKMNTNLTSVIPHDQPYNIAPWNYYGNETIDNSFITTNKIVDWVLVELRTGSSASNATTVVERKAVPINEDGFIVDPNYGTTNVKFKVDAGDYYIAVYHRNHLSVMSSQEVTLTN